MSTGAYIRICRNSKWESVEIDRLTHKELTWYVEKYPERAPALVIFLAGWIREHVAE